MTEWTNDLAIQQWGAMPRAVLEQMAEDGDFAKHAFATEQEAAAPKGIQYIQADLCSLPDLGTPFDAVVARFPFP